MSDNFYNYAPTDRGILNEIRKYPYRLKKSVTYENPSEYGLYIGYQ